MMRSAVQKRQLIIDEMLCVAGPVFKKMDVKIEDQLMEVVVVVESAALPEPDTIVINTMSKVREEMYPVCLFRNVDFRESVNEHEPTYREHFFESVHLMLRNPLYVVQSGCEDVISQFVVLVLETTADAVAFGKQLKRQRARGYLPCSVIQFCPWNKVLSRISEEEIGGSDGAEGIAIEDVAMKKTVVMEVKDAPLLCGKKCGA